MSRLDPLRERQEFIEAMEAERELSSQAERSQPCEDAAAILMQENVFVGDEKFQFTHQPEADRKENGDG